MSTSSNVSLGALRIQSQQRADMENNPAISTPEWNNNISNSAKALYDKLVGAYGNDYEMALPYQFTIGNVNTYPLPDGTPTYKAVDGSIAPKFYKLAGVDLQYSSSPNGWVTLRNFEFIERNKYAYPNSTTNYLAYTNLRYKLLGNNIFFIPVPAASQLIQLWYAPAPNSLQYLPVCSTTISSTTITCSDVTGLVVGMSVYGPNIPSKVAISSINTTNNTFVISSPASSTNPVVVLQCWLDSATVDGISGWEEYIIVDAAIKAKIKQGFDASELRIEKQEMIDRIESMAEGRDMGQAYHVSDALSINDQGSGFDQGGMGEGW